MKWFRSLIGEPQENIRRSPVRQADTGHLEPHSETWIYVSNYAQEELAALRQKNDLPKWDALETAELRGQIKALKKLLALAQPKADKRRSSLEEE